MYRSFHKKYWQYWCIGSWEEEEEEDTPFSPTVLRLFPVWKGYGLCILNLYFPTQIQDILVVARIMKKEYTWENNSTSNIFFKQWEDLRKWDLYKWDVSRNFTNPTDIVLDKKDVIYMDTLQTVLSLSKTYGCLWNLLSEHLHHIHL